MMKPRDSFVCSKVEAEVGDVFSGEEGNLTNTKVMTKGGVTIRKVRNKPADGNKPLDFNLPRLQDGVYHLLILWLVEFTVPPPSTKDFGEASFVTNLVR